MFYPLNYEDNKKLRLSGASDVFPSVNDFEGVAVLNIEYLIFRVQLCRFQDIYAQIGGTCEHRTHDPRFMRALLLTTELRFHKNKRGVCLKN